MIESSAFAVTVDVAAFWVSSGRLEVVVIQRSHPPFQGHVALPGGFVEPDEGLEEAAARELLEETGAAVPRLRQFGAYGEPGRDPRGRILSVAYWAPVSDPDAISGGDDAARAYLERVDALLADPSTLAFDHHKMLGDAVSALRRAVGETGAATWFLPKSFTLPELRSVFEAVWGVHLDPHFDSAAASALGLVERVGRSTRYRAGGATRIDPPLRPF